MASKNKLNFYRNAPDVEVLDLDGQPVQLSTLWQKKPLLLAFTRHFGCTQCKEMLDYKGNTVRLSDYKGESNVILIFNRAFT